TEQIRKVRPLRVPEDEGAIAARRIHDRPNVVRPLLERGRVGWTIRESRPSFVKSNQSTERAEPRQKPGLLRPFPVEVKVGGGPWRDHAVDGARSRDLVRDVDIAALGIPRVGLHGPRQCPPRPSRVAMSPDTAKVRLREGPEW